MIRENFELAQERKDIVEGKDKLVLKLSQENLNLRRDFAEKDDVLDEFI